MSIPLRNGSGQLQHSRCTLVPPKGPLGWCHLSTALALCLHGPRASLLPLAAPVLGTQLFSLQKKRSPAVTTGPAGAKDQGLDTESAGLAAYSDNCARSGDKPGKAAKPVPGEPIPAQDQKHVGASLLSADGRENDGPVEVPLPVQSLPGYDAELHSGTTLARCRAKMTGMVRTVVGACKDAVFTGAVLPGQTLQH